MAAVTIRSDFGIPKIKSATVSTVSPSISHEVMGLDSMILVFWMLNFKPTFSLSSFTFKRLFSSSSLSAVRVVPSAYLRCYILLPCLFNLYEEWVRNTDKSWEKVDLICQYPIILLLTISIFLQILGQDVPFLSSFGRISLGHILLWEATSMLLLSLERDSKFCTLR